MTSNVLRYGKLATLSLIACISVLQSGCTDREVGAGFAGFAIATILADGNSYPPPRPPPPPPHYDRCAPYTYTDCVDVRVYGGWRRDCSTRVVQRCTPRYNMQLASAQPSLNAAEIARNYKLTTEGATKIVTALNAARDSKNEGEAQIALAPIGIQLTDIKAMSLSGMPTVAMIDSVAQAVDQNPEETKNMLYRLISVARAQEAARNEH